MPIVNVHEAKTHLSRLLERAAKGERIVIARAGKPVAVLGPLNESLQPRKPGLLKGRIRLTKDFDAPLPDALLDSFHSGPIEPE
jgi:prevent-host-death family protein